MVHQPSGGFRGVASDIERHAEDILAIKKRLNEIYVKHTGQPYEIVERTLDRDSFMTASEAQAFGIVDKVYEKGRRLPNEASVDLRFGWGFSAVPLVFQSSA